MLLVSLCALTLLGACAGAPRVTDALDGWRRGRHDAVIEAARNEVERFRKDNHLARADVEGSLAEVDRMLSEETPILLPDPAPAQPDGDPLDQVNTLDRGLRRDLAAAGATRTLRALRVVERLALRRFAPDLILAIWRREPWEADGPLLLGATLALRSVTVKTAALRALEALQ